MGADCFSMGVTLQVVAKADTTWRDAHAPLRELVSRDPMQRRGLASVQAELFSGRRSAAPVSRAERSLLELQQVLAFQPWTQEGPSTKNVDFTPSTKNVAPARHRSLVSGPSAKRQNPQ